MEKQVYLSRCPVPATKSLGVEFIFIPAVAVNNVNEVSNLDSGSDAERGDVLCLVGDSTS